MDPLQQLDVLAEGVAAASPEELDVLLRAGADPVLCGAWLGRWLVRNRGGRWVGLHEPVAPRVAVRGLIVSPIDACQRRQSIPALLAQLDVPPPAQDNRAAWDRLADDARFAGPIPLSPDGVDPWLGDLRGKDLLCLAAGGGRQGPLHAAAGARVTVVDFSERQLEHDRKAGLKTLCASMDDLSALASGSFDVVVQPVSSCYVADVEPVYREVARVLRPGGLYVAQHKQPGALLPEPGMSEYAHPLEALLGGLCRSGFAIEDVQEPPRGDAWAPPGSTAHRAWLQPPYLKIKARRLTS